MRSKLLKVLFFLLSLSVALRPFDASAGTIVFQGAPWSGQVTRITTCNQIKAIIRNLTLSYTLVSDVDCSGSDFATIGNALKQFTGKFDGLNHKITNVKMAKANSISQNGLFVSSKDATFKNLTIQNFTPSLSFAEHRVEAPNLSYSMFGKRVKVSGNNLAVTDPVDSDNGDQSGAVYMFEKVGHAWQFKQKIYALAPNKYDFFGGEIDLQGDRLVVTNGYYDSMIGVFIFIKQNGKWIQQTELGLANVDQIAQDGDTIAVTNTNKEIQFLQFSGTQWVSGQKISMPDEIKTAGNYQFAANIALKGGYLVVGAPEGTPQVKDQNGKMAIYIKGSNGQWALQRVINGSHPDFGESVSIDGNIAVVGDRVGVYTIDVSNPASTLNTLADTTTDYPNMFIGQKVQIHDKVIGFSVGPSPFVTFTESIPSEKVAFYKMLEDNKWHLLGEFKSSVTPDLSSNMLHISGYGFGMDFDDQNIFIGAPYGDALAKLKNRGALYLYSDVNSLQQPT